MRDCYIVDIDGTVADASHRIHHIKKKPKDWNSFFAECINDAPIPHMHKLVSLLQVTGVIWVSGRPERTKIDTLEWLYKHSFIHGPDPLYMRADGDYRDDDIIKYELLQKLKEDGWNPLMAFDDRDRIVKMWRANGIPCLQVAEGNF